MTDRERLTVVGIFPWNRFWSIGEGKGSPSFYLSPRAFVEAGHRMIVLMPRGDEKVGVSTYRGIEVVRYGGGPHSILENRHQGRVVRFFVRNFGYVRFFFATLVAGIRVCRQVKPDAFIAYGDHSPPVTWVLSRLFRAPMVTRLFGTFLSNYLTNRLALYYHYIQVLALTTPASYIVFANDGSRGDEVAAALGVPMDRFLHWRNGVDHGIYDPGADRATLRAELNLSDASPVLITVSRLDAEKHVDFILEALPSLRIAFPSIRFVVCGEGADQPRLERVAAAAGVADCVVWAGSVPQDRLGHYLQAADVFVAMSDRTNAANPLFEAMLCARPCVVRNTGRTADVVRDGENGWLIPEDEPSNLATVLHTVLSDPDRARRVGEAARAWALEHIPTWKRRQEMEVEVVERAVREARAR